LTMRAVPERLRDVSCGGAIQIDYLYLYLYSHAALWACYFPERKGCRVYR